MLDLFDGFLELVDGCRLSSSHINQPEEIIEWVEVGAVGGPIGFVADDATPKL